MTVLRGILVKLAPNKITTSIGRLVICLAHWSDGGLILVLCVCVCVWEQIDKYRYIKEIKICDASIVCLMVPLSFE
jgi:hypothetical protein